MGRTRLLIGVLGTLVTLAMVPVAAMTTVVVWLETCSGDGGYPYSAPGSTAARFCDSVASMPYFVAMFEAPVVVALCFAVWAVHEQRLGRLAIGLGLALGVLLTMCVVVSSLPSS